LVFIGNITPSNEALMLTAPLGTVICSLNSLKKPS
jgi:hypothetical protein